jgi:hypothetical protein
MKILTVFIVFLGVVSQAADIVKEQEGKSLKHVSEAVRALSLSNPKVTIYSLNPDLPPLNPTKKPKFAFYGFPVLGSSEIEDEKTKTLLIEALAKSIPDKEPDYDVNCFAPKHGLRVATIKSTNEFVICFSCQKASAYGFREASWFYLNARGSNDFSSVLRRHKIPIAK